MAKNETKSLAAAVLKADKDGLAAIKKMTGYKSAKPEYELAKLSEEATKLVEADEAFAQAETAWQAARDAHVGAQWRFHNAMLGAKQQVIAVFGDDSDEAQAVGLKKKSERAKPTTKAKSGTTPPPPA